MLLAAPFCFSTVSLIARKLPALNAGRFCADKASFYPMFLLLCTPQVDGNPSIECGINAC